MVVDCGYHSVPGKHPWALNHKPSFYSVRKYLHEVNFNFVFLDINFDERLQCYLGSRYLGTFYSSSQNSYMHGRLPGSGRLPRTLQYLTLEQFTICMVTRPPRVRWTTRTHTLSWLCKYTCHRYYTYPKLYLLECTCIASGGWKFWRRGKGLGRVVDKIKRLLKHNLQNLMMWYWQIMYKTSTKYYWCFPNLSFPFMSTA